jgi:acetone carboxylase gamma subunit
MAIIGLVGFIGAGKGTVGELLRLHGYKQMSFAGALKDTASTMFGWDRDLLEGDTVESRVFREQKDEFWSSRFGYDFSPRLALQMLGTEAGRDVFHKDIWIYALENRIKKLPKVVITDTRFPNEIEFIRKNGGVIVEVKRGEQPEWVQTAWHTNNQWLMKDDMPTMAEKYPNVHVSEWAWIGQKIDFTINNSGTLKDLKKGVDNLLTLIEVRDNINMLHNDEGVVNEVFA